MELFLKMYKFRTMTDEKNENGELLPDSVRLTKFGKFYVLHHLMNYQGFLTFLKAICQL